MKVSRRAVLAGAAGAIALRKGVFGQQPADAAASDTTKRPGRAPSAVGLRAPSEKAERNVRASWSYTPHQDLMGTITPADLHALRAAPRRCSRRRSEVVLAHDPRHGRALNG